MYQGDIQPVPQRCSVCGNGPWHPQLNEYKNYDTNELITEATWCCGCCGARFGEGEISRTPIIGEGVKHDKLNDKMRSCARKYKVKKRRA